MANGRAEVMQSAAYLAMTPCGRRVLHLIEDAISRCGGAAALPRSYFLACGISQAAVSFGVKQIQRLGFVTVEAEVGARRTNVFSLADDWRAIGADEAARLVKLARLPKPPRVAAPKPPRPEPAPKPVERPRTMQRGVPSLPRLSFMDEGR